MLIKYPIAMKDIESANIQDKYSFWNDISEDRLWQNRKEKMLIKRSNSKFVLVALFMQIWTLALGHPCKSRLDAIILLPEDGLLQWSW